MTLPRTLSTEPPEHPAMDFAFLRREGIRLLERLGGRLWTDFNAHDPGITILEQVCYAITDLAYRINYDIKDILASKEANPYRSLHSPAEVLTTNPVTVADFRKLLIDISGVKNAWLEPFDNVEPGIIYDPSDDTIYLDAAGPQPAHREPVPLSGIYRVLLEVDGRQGVPASDILTEVNRRLNACRSLAEDFIPPQILPGQGIVVNASVEISAVDDPEQLLANIYDALSRAISPGVRFYTLAERLSQGKRIDEIMDGPVLEHGFISDTELDAIERKVGLRTSDLVQEILDVDGTLSIRRIALSDGIHKESWYLKLAPLSTPFLNIEGSLFAPDGPTIQLVRGGLAVQVDTRRVADILNRPKAQGVPGILPESQRDVRLQPGRERRIGQYYSIQNQFPATYGIGTVGLPDSASKARKAQAKQLKAYLMFFDQLLANYFAQIGNAKDLFSFYAEQPRTYFSQIVEDAGLGIDEIRRGDVEAHRARVQEITEKKADGSAARDSGFPAAADRKNRFLNHLLARFAEQFTDYSLLLYAHLNEKELIEDKSAFLRDYHQIGKQRGSGFDYTRSAWGTENVSGLEKRISRKLGIASLDKQDLAVMDSTANGGFHMVEHILLRPGSADLEQWTQTVDGLGRQATGFLAGSSGSDPYSHQVSFVFPKWMARFSVKGFSDLVEKTVREETPAHIRVYVHWLDRNEMLAFEDAYKTWLECVVEGRQWDASNSLLNTDRRHMIFVRLRNARDRLVQLLDIGVPYPLRDLELVYPSMVTYNCPTAIQIKDGQSDVLYQLCDEDGNPITEKDTRFEARFDGKTAGGSVPVPTPVILKDVFFTVLAVRESRNIRLETYLSQPVSIKVGIDTRSPVAVVPTESQVADGDQVVVNFGDKISVTVGKTQEGISYKLVDRESSALSRPLKGNQSSITLVSSRGFEEDTAVSVSAYRTAAWKVSAVLDTVVTVKVRPNPAVPITAASSIVDYGADTTLTLVSPQSSVEYRLYRRELSRADYLIGDTDSLVVETDEGRRVFIRKPEQVANWDALGDFVPQGMFEKRKKALSVVAEHLLEDSLFIVQATKVDNRETLQLSQAVAVLVRPDPSPVVGVLRDTVDIGQNGVVTLENTQRGVAYQLRRDADNIPVNRPGYHVTDRGVETTRVEVDLVVEGQGDAVLALPTDALTETTGFNVLASKLQTGVSAQLTGKATLDVRAPTDGDEH